MRIIKIIWFDMILQYKYGFYFLYALLTILYISFINFIPVNLQENVRLFCIYIDPTAIGFFFMGSIVLLEKNQNIFSPLVVSPISFMSYLTGKVVSLSVISTLSTLYITFFTTHTLDFIMLLSVFTGTSLFSILGMLGALYSETLNRFILLSTILELIFCVPGVLYLFNIFPELTMFHFASSIIDGIRGNMVALLIIIAWLGLCLTICYPVMNKKYRSLGGA